MTITADHAHWGIAAYVFSLDLAGELAPFAVQDCPWDAVRAAAREAILENREAVEAGGAPLLLCDAMAQVLGEGARGPSRAFFDWVETGLVTAARPRNARHPLLAPLLDPGLMAQVDRALGYPSAEAVSYTARLHGAIDAQASEALLDAVFEADARIDRKVLSDWDRALVGRNAELHSPDDPLSPLIHSLGQSLLIDAAGHVSEALGPDRAGVLHGLCAAERAT